MAQQKQAGGWHALAHRWFVQYNPLYLVSAALVLAGVFLLSRGLARTESLSAELWLTAVTELYQVLLIGSAALLQRAGQRRPAVMLALLESIYLGDLTLQTGVAPMLGPAGLAASGVWYALFLLKLRALCWAVRVKAPAGTWALLALAGALLAATPHALHHSSQETRDKLLPLVAFLLSAAACWSGRRVESAVLLDDWGRTVLRRVRLVGWPAWALLATSHMLWWSVEYSASPTPVLAGAALPWIMRRARTERGVWLAAGACLALGMFSVHLPFPVAALMAGCAMALRAWRGPGFGLQPADEASAPDVHPYRLGADPTAQPPPPAAPALPSVAQQVRLTVGVLCCGYLALWVAIGTDGSPHHLDHVLPLELVTSALLGLLVWRCRSRLALAPLTLLWLPYPLTAAMNNMPTGPVQWGALLLALGFGALICGVLLNYLLRAPSGGKIPDP